MYKLVLADFPYTEKQGSKIRPVLLLTDGSYGKHKIVVVAYVTSKNAEGLSSEVSIKRSKTNKLDKSSIIKLHKIVNIPDSALKGELGILTELETKEVKLKLRKLFQI